MIHVTKYNFDVMSNFQLSVNAPYYYSIRLTKKAGYERGHNKFLF